MRSVGYRTYPTKGFNMAKRASETFVIALKDGKRAFEKNQEVPADVAKKVPNLVYDDGAKTPAAKS